MQQPAEKSHCLGAELSFRLPHTNWPLFFGLPCRGVLFDLSKSSETIPCFGAQLSHRSPRRRSSQGPLPERRPPAGGTLPWGSSLGPPEPWGGPQGLSCRCSWEGKGHGRASVVEPIFFYIEMAQYLLPAMAQCSPLVSKGPVKASFGNCSFYYASGGLDLSFSKQSLLSMRPSVPF